MANYIIIPAHVASKRLKNKLLLNIDGKPMIQHVYDKAMKCKFNSVIISTNSYEIKNIARNFGANVYMNEKYHTSGTSRIAELVKSFNIDGNDIIVNLQGDEPFIPICNIMQVAKLLHNARYANISTLYAKITDFVDIYSFNIVKVVLDCYGHALYFSRSYIPWLQYFTNKVKYVDNLKFYLQHIGLYAYRASFLKYYNKIPMSYLENMESLEQLKLLYNSQKIILEQVVTLGSYGINSLSDLFKINSNYSNYCSKL